jgi:hypothetical protein
MENHPIGSVMSLSYKQPRLAFLSLPLALGLLVCGEVQEGSDCATKSPGETCEDSSGCFDGQCYAIGAYPDDTPCTEDNQCVGLLCAQDTQACSRTCQNDQQCLAGWSCYSTQECKKNNSLTRGELCERSIFCSIQDTCAGGACQRPCAQGYTAQGCNEGEYCKVDEIPICVSSQCDPGASTIQCASPRTCADLDSGLGVCRTPCTLSFGTTGFINTCTRGIGLFETTCAPLGTDNQPYCIESDDTRQSGQACDGGQSLCPTGTACLSGGCRQLCTDTGHCPSGQGCTLVGSEIAACF